MPRVLALGLDHSDFIAAMAPKPVILLGKEKDDGVDVYHLALEPLRDPERNRLRELWVDAKTILIELLMAGFFAVARVVAMQSLASLAVPVRARTGAARR